MAAESAEALQIVDTLYEYASVPGGGFVYAVGHPDGFVKIGRASNPFARISDLQTGSPYELRLLSYTGFYNVSDAEALLLAKFDPWLVRGEWFNLPSGLAEILCDNQRVRELVDELRGHEESGSK